MSQDTNYNYFDIVRSDIRVAIVGIILNYSVTKDKGFKKA